MNQVRKRCAVIAKHRLFRNSIIGLIILNAILVGLETYPYFIVNYATILYIADQVLLWVFTVEILIRLTGSNSIRSFFREPWNLFDFVIILGGHVLIGAHYVTVLRILRVLRVLRAISVIPSLRKMVNALLLTIPSMGTILLLLGIFFYIYAVIGTMLFQTTAPEYFGTLHDTLLTLFQLLTLDSWSSGVMRPLLTAEPFAWVYFFSFVIIGAFVIINLFVGVVVNNVEEANREETPSPTDEKLAEMQKELQDIKKLLEKKSG
ncbi:MULTISPECIES: ion transporter [Oceanobacillus]|uniref:Ion transporter n=1 Tax=Oceanobacillus profundus TaxID=372463 RepID=A0A417YNL3_9BACI|nr:ion transporter [Oceanobacillus profundus]MCM3398485.1 ion transporter [Oceanobacillus profundus]PAE27248.1 voltage-gated sodium channel [Paenibacillus sp. 7884-2]RHW35316.1 ion transporter [Oceanobacillus profundus]